MLIAVVVNLEANLVTVFVYLTEYFELFCRSQSFECC